MADAPINEIPTSVSEFDAYAAEYDKALGQGLRLTGESKEYYAENRVKWLTQRLTRVAPSAGLHSILDFGCGTGSSCPFLLQGHEERHYLGYDPSEQSVALARTGFGDLRAAFESTPQNVPSNAFDLAFTNGVFHHIPPKQRAEAAALVWRSLKPGGHFAFWENNRWNPMVHFVMSRVPFDRDAQMLFPHQARRLLIDAGFEIVLTDYLFVFPGALKYLRPIERSLCKLPLGGQYLVFARKPHSSPTPSAA